MKNHQETMFQVIAVKSFYSYILMIKIMIKHIIKESHRIRKVGFILISSNKHIAGLSVRGA